VHGWNQLRTLDPYLLRRDGGRASRSRLIVKLLGPVEAIQTLRHRLPSERVAAYGDRASS
jgi:hypothetical protein